MKVEIDVNIEWVMSELAKMSKMDAGWGYPAWLEAVDPSTVDLSAPHLAHIAKRVGAAGVPPLVQTQRGYEAFVEDVFAARGGYDPANPSHVKIARYLNANVFEVEGQDGQTYLVPEQNLARGYFVMQHIKDTMPGVIDRAAGAVIPSENNWCVPVGLRHVWKLEDDAVFVAVGPQIPAMASALIDLLKTAPDEAARRDAIARAASFIMGSQIKATSVGYIHVPLNMLRTLGNDEVTIVGAYDHYEIWDRAVWDKLEDQFAMEDLAAYFGLPLE